MNYIVSFSKESLIIAFMLKKTPAFPIIIELQENSNMFYMYMENILALLGYNVMNMMKLL